MLRSYWGAVGTALVSIALVGTLAEITAVTTSDRTHIPLWPLALCVVLFIIGRLLFIFRSRNTPSDGVTATPPDTAATTGRSYPKREFADVTGPGDILRVFRQNTTIQAEKLVRPYLDTAGIDR
jgi:hypothetical protein